MDCLKKSIKLFVATLITLTIGVMLSSTAQAATVHYVDYDKTTENIRKEIKQGKPTEADLQDGSHAVYVYRKIILVAYRFQNEVQNYQILVQ